MSFKKKLMSLFLLLVLVTGFLAIYEPLHGKIYATYISIFYNDEASLQFKNMVRRSNGSVSYDDIETLLSEGAYIDTMIGDRATLLGMAARGGNLKLIQYLIVNGADVNGYNILGRILDLFKDKSVGENKIPRSRQIEIINLLIEKGLNVDEIHDLAKAGFDDQVEYIIDNNPGTTYILHRNADFYYYTVSQSDLINYAFCGAIIVGNVDMINSMFNRGVDIEHCGSSYAFQIFYTPLKLAVEYSQIRSVDALIKLGVDVSEKPKDNQTALWQAAKRGDLEIVKLLMASGADANQLANDEYEYRYLNEDEPGATYKIPGMNAWYMRKRKNYNAHAIALAYGNSDVVELFKEKAVPLVPENVSMMILKSSVEEKVELTAAQIADNFFKKIWNLDNTLSQNCHVSLHGDKTIADDRLILKNTQASFLSDCNISDYVHLIIASGDNKKLDSLLNMREDLPDGWFSLDGNVPATYSFDEVIGEGKLFWFTSKEALNSIEDVISLGYKLEVSEFSVNKVYERLP